MPTGQIDEFNRHLARANEVLPALGPSARLLRQMIVSATLRLMLLQTTLDWLSERAAVVSVLKLSSLMPAGETDSAALAGTSSLIDRVQRECVMLWGSLLAQEQFAREVAREFKDAPVIPAEVQATLKRARADLEALYSEAEPYLESVERPPADPEVLDALRVRLHRDEQLYL